MELTLRPGKPEDAETCAQICYKAFTAIARQHNFPPDLPGPEAAVGLLSMMLSNPKFYSVVAEANGQVVGSNFLDERSTVVGVGPITVDPTIQDGGVGRALMQAVIRRATERAAPGIRLVQSAYHNRSLSLYAKLGFHVRDVLACIQGTPPKGEISGYETRRATPADLEACNAVCRHVHGHDRSGELTDALTQGTALVVEHDGRISGYATDLAFFAHAVGEGNEDLKALIMAADEFGGPGILVPTTNADLFRWCLQQDLKVVQLMTLMTVGLYTPPAGACLPSILY
ncbi:MAG: GNAT family N-acetyltransferase [Actinomycetota bacterium]|nr:GNAT family N-acetyltransferase [Actinomycetota bacterium]